MASAPVKNKQAADELTDPGYSDDQPEGPVTLEELYDAVAELRGLVMVLAEPVILRSEAKAASQAKREAAANGDQIFPGSVAAYFKALANQLPVVADASAPARQLVIDAMAVATQLATPAKTAAGAYRGMSAADKKRIRGFYLTHCDALPDPLADVAE